MVIIHPYTVKTAKIITVLLQHSILTS